MKHARLVDAIEQGVRSLRQTLPEGAAERLATLLEELARWNRRINLTAIREPSAMVGGHVLDSLAVRPLLHGKSVIDLGTGAGFPGLPLAIAEPAREFELLDSNRKKISFVRHAIGMLGLANARAVRARAEGYAPGKRFDTVIARALAKAPRLTELGEHLLGEGGVLLALKGKYPADELRAVPGDWDYDVIELTIPSLEHRSRHVIVLTRRGSETM